jgi:class 3 adenylate cyclase
MEGSTGTVTFSFNDIEGSSLLWEQYRGGMPLALGRHDEIVRSTIAGRGGYVFSAVGDSFTAAF